MRCSNRDSCMVTPSTVVESRLLTGIVHFAVTLAVKLLQRVFESRFLHCKTRISELGNPNIRPEIFKVPTTGSKKSSWNNFLVCQACFFGIILAQIQISRDLCRQNSRSRGIYRDRLFLDLARIIIGPDLCAIIILAQPNFLARESPKDKNEIFMCGFSEMGKRGLFAKCGFYNKISLFSLVFTDFLLDFEDISAISLICTPNSRVFGLLQAKISGLFHIYVAIISKIGRFARFSPSYRGFCC